MCKKNINILRTSLLVVAGIGIYIWGANFAGSDLKPELIGFTIGLAVTLAVDALTFLYEERSLLNVYINCFILRPNSPLRLSIAYLFRIESNGKYLLVKNERFKTPTYQPVGGVYKYFNPDGKRVLEQMTIVTDNSIENDKTSEFDLRLKMRKRRHIWAFVLWFRTRKQREITPWREFHEELLATKILPKRAFPYIYFELSGQHLEAIHHDKYFKVDTLKYVDIYTPRFINEQQKDALSRLSGNPTEEFVWVTEEEINKGLTECGKRIAPHSHKIFHNQLIN